MLLRQQINLALMRGRVLPPGRRLEFRVAVSEAHRGSEAQSGAVTPGLQIGISPSGTGLSPLAFRLFPPPPLPLSPSHLLTFSP